MDGYQLLSLIGTKKPRYDSKYRTLIETISQKGDTTGSGDFSTFGAFYQTFMYAFIVGLHLIDKHGYAKEYLDNSSEKQEFAPLAQWKPSGIKDFILMTLLNRTDDFRTPFDWMGLENASDENLSNFSVQLIRELEAYANVGLKYIQNLWDNQKVIFNDPFVFVNILSDISNQTNGAKSVD